MPPGQWNGSAVTLPAFIQKQDMSSKWTGVPEEKGTVPLGLRVAVTSEGGILPSSHSSPGMLEPASPWDTCLSKASPTCRCRWRKADIFAGYAKPQQPTQWGGGGGGGGVVLLLPPSPCGPGESRQASGGIMPIMNRVQSRNLLYQQPSLPGQYRWSRLGDELWAKAAHLHPKTFKMLSVTPSSMPRENISWKT